MIQYIQTKVNTISGGAGMKINVTGENITQDEINAYIEYGKKKYHVFK